MISLDDWQVDQVVGAVLLHADRCTTDGCQPQMDRPCVICRTAEDIQGWLDSRGRSRGEGDAAR